MSIYRFGRLGTLFRDDHPISLYIGRRRMSPPPALVWWWPINWIVVSIGIPVVLVLMAAKALRNKGAV